jgi:hypothetical protein
VTDQFWCAHPHFFSMGTRELLSPGREADHSPPSIAEVNNAFHYTSKPLIHVHRVVLD